MKLKPYHIYFLIALIILIFDFFKFEIAEDWFIYDFFIRFGLWFIALVCVATGIFKIIWKQEKIKLSSFSLFLIGTALVIGLYSFKDISNDEQILLRANYDGDINGLTLELFENGTYKIHDYSILGGDMKRGEYELKEDTIKFHNKYPLGEDRDFFPNKILILNDSTIELITDDEYDKKWLKFRITENRITGG